MPVIKTDDDYAIEFGRHLANAAERFLAEQNSAAIDDRLPDADYWRDLESAIHEFRKRADRAEATIGLVRRLAAQQRRRETRPG
jgi:hypothetical protein